MLCLLITLIIIGLTSVSPCHEKRGHIFSMLAWIGRFLHITTGVLEQNFTPDALPDTTPGSQSKTFPSSGGSLAFDASTSSHDSESKRQTTAYSAAQYTMTVYITASLHYLEAISPICHLEDCTRIVVIAHLGHINDRSMQSRHQYSHFYSEHFAWLYLLYPQAHCCVHRPIGYHFCTKLSVCCSVSV